MTTNNPAEIPLRRAAVGEAALIEAARGGDELAFQRLLRRHRGLLEEQARRFYLPGGDADDVLQEARIGFAQAARCYHPDHGASFATFARLCVTRQLASAVTAARRGKHQPLNDAARGGAADRAWACLPAREDASDLALAHERLAELRAAAQGLSALERQLLAHALVGWSSGETARRLGLKRKSADNALQRARSKVRDWYVSDASSPTSGGGCLSQPRRAPGRSS
jgi:RNA polymerase sporulation-specific sigma factor